MPVAVTAAMAAALALGAYAGSLVLLLAVVLTQAAVISGWHRSVDVPGLLGGAMLAGAAALTADILLVARDDSRPLDPVAGVLGCAVLGGFVHQLARRDSRVRLTASLTATLALVVLAVLGALYLAARETRGEAALVALVALAVLAARVADVAPLPPLHRGAAAVVAGGAVGLVVATVTDIAAGAGLLLGLAAAVTATAAVQLVGGAGRPAWLPAAALPLLLAAPVAYILGRLLV
jgi:hypothetical protein